MKVFISIIIICISISLSAQTSVKGRVIDQDSKAVDFASVFLFSAKDSSLVKAGYSEQNGNFQLDIIKGGKFFLKATIIGYQDYSSEVFDVSESEVRTFPDVKLNQSSKDLAEVEVKTTRPLVEVRADKTVFNVEGTINATGQTGLELLRKAPGVVVDNNNHISVKGRTGVQVFIDGKPAPFAGDDLANYLSNLQSSQIQSIDIITNPSSKYEAAGTAGIIDIRLKKAQNIGGNASINMGYNQGIYAKGYAGVSGNYRTQIFNAFGSYSYFQGHRTSYDNFRRQQSGMLYDQHALKQSFVYSHSYKAGFDYFINPKSTIGVQVNGNPNDGKWGPQTRSDIGNIGGPITEVLQSQGSNPYNTTNNNFNLNYRYDDGKGQSLNIDADYGLYNSGGNNDLINTYYNANESAVLFTNHNQNDNSTDIDIYATKVDYENNLWGGKFGIGGKTASVVTDNDFKFYDIKDGVSIINEDRTNRFTYDEKINAAYINYNRNLSKTISFQAGVRMENTHSVGELSGLKPIEEEDQKVERNYVDFFPSGGLSWQMDKNNSLGLTYSRRIDRPNYQSLNPFEYKLDELTYQKGNSFLRPQYSHSIELSHSYMGFLNSSINYTHTDDLFAEIVLQANDSAAVLQTLNVATQENFGLNVNASVPIKSWWSVFINMGGNYTYNNADLGDGNKVNLELVTGNIYLQQTFILPHDLNLELSGYYNTPGLWGGNFKTNAIWSIDFGIQKKILHKKGTIKLSLTDLFNTANWGGTTDIGELHISATGGYESRQARLSFSYSIGNQKSKSKNRATGLEEENKRLQGNGGK